MNTYEMINTVLLAEDNLEHCFFFKKALKEISYSTQLTEVHDGDELMQFLQSFLPDLLFLDLNMPCKDGVQCIKEIRENRIYDALPIIVFTITKQENAIQAAYGFGANLFFSKPGEYADLVSSLKAILFMDWKRPKSVTEKYFRDNRHSSFNLDQIA